MSDSFTLPPNLPPGEIIRRARLFRRITQQELARRTGIDRGNISKYERGDRIPRPSTLDDILTALQVPRPQAGFFAALDRLLAEPAPPGTPGPEERDELLRGITRTLEQMIGLALFKVGLAPEQPEVAPRQSGVPPRKEEAVCLWLCEESEKAASDVAGEARAMAEVACILAHRMVRAAPQSPRYLRLAGQAEALLANALRVVGNHAAAEEAAARARPLWEAGETSAGLLSEAWLLDLEASLRRDQRRFPEALSLHSRALHKARPAETGAILLNQSATEVHMGAYEAALGTLAQAAPGIDAATQPRLRCVLEYNRAMSFVRLGRAAEAEPFVTEARRLADRLGNGLDLVNTRYLEGLTDAGLGRTEAALEKLEEVCVAFAERGHPYDFALVGLDLALLYRETGRWAAIRELANRMVVIFQERNIHRETIAALILFQEAAETEALTVELVRRLQEYLKEAQAAPGVRFGVKAEAPKDK